MAPLETPALRKWLCFGTGVGVVPSDHNLDFLIVRVRPTGPVVVARHVVENYRERPASEWGSEVVRFLEKRGAGHVGASILLPREQVIIRRVVLPGVSDEDAPAALQFQLESLHPWASEDVISDFQRIGRTGTFLVGITEQARVNEWTSLFAEAGIRLAGLTFGASALRTAARLYHAPASPEFLCVRGLQANETDPVEIYGESEAAPVFTAEFEMPLDRAVSLAVSEMRLAPETEPLDWVEILPPWKSAPDSLDLSDAGKSRLALPYGIALSAACPWLGRSLNLLPEPMRTASNRGMYVPTIALATLLALLSIGLLIQRAVLERSYLQKLETEIRTLEPIARQVEGIDRETAATAQKIRSLDEFHNRTRLDLNTMQELTRLIPPPAYLTSLQMSGKELQVSGEIEQATGLLKKLDESPYFSGSEFMMPLTRGAGGEVFRVRALRDTVVQPLPAVPAAAVTPAVAVAPGGKQ